jgi:hypothetical protein
MEWRTIGGWLSGFLGASLIQILFLWLKEHKEKQLLRKSLNRELVSIYVSLSELLPNLDMKGPPEREPNPANLAEFVKAECFNTAKSAPVFWRWKDAFGIAQAHEGFCYLAVSRPADMGSAAKRIENVLTMFRNSANNRLSLNDLLKNSDGKLSKADFSK